MKTSELFDLLKQHQEKPLLFEYAPNLLIGANYHITEVKHLKIDSVDCGAGTDAWSETIIQLWESPEEIGKTEFMQVSKALSILDKVGHMKAYDLEAEVKFEYSNANFHTAHLFVTGFSIKNGNLLIQLDVNPTDCKAKETCGVAEPSMASSSECAPGGGCC
ncbi:hypothetical protein APR41_02290 [Salegentibacter salinarum]|uniref:Uncharacterized protein n=1 Tax=Salegentibacter salinarum TaxID=447422 RepID=A0A2N0U4M3_9FLAO|nr:DUF6428 family protein [Salegentibacter salinarum]PKD21828.1 hypothetical protein APR41_02290 [Salegentibacter salinarum]SKB33087.1 hypothetical protein SAMN05660903_00101 [Salegentibacter salinarum]